MPSAPKPSSFGDCHQAAWGRAAGRAGLGTPSTRPASSRSGFGSRHQAHRDRDDRVGDEGDDRAVEVLRLGGLDRHPGVPDVPAADVEAGEGEVADHRAEGAGDQPPEAAPRGGALPEHPDEERREQRRVEDREQQLDVVHDVRVAGGDERREDADQHPGHRGEAPDPQVVRVGPVPPEVRPPDVVGEDRVEGAHVRGHAGHERGQQAGQRDPEHAVGQQYCPSAAGSRR